MASAKGGSGKTVLTATFAAFLAGIGKKVLIIDTDASTNGLTLMYLKEVMLNNELVLSTSQKPIGTFEINDSTRYPSIITLDNKVDFIPASYSFKNTETIDLKNFTVGLKRIINLTEDSYDFIFLDAQAGSDLYAYTAMQRGVSHEVIIVSEYDPLSAAGIERLKGLFREDLTYDRTWVLLNKMLPDFVQSFSDFLEVAKYLNPIAWDADVVRAYARRKLAIDMEEGNEFTIGIMQTLKTLFGDLISREIDIWLNNKVESIKKPIFRQYFDVKNDLERLKDLQLQNKKRKLLIEVCFNAVLVTAAITGVYLLVYKTNFTSIMSSEFKNFDFAFIVLISTIVLLISRTIQKIKTISKDNDMDKYSAEIEYLEEKFKKLSILKDANFTELVKKK